MYFGNVQLNPLPNQTSLNTTVDLGPQATVADLLVEVQGSLDSATGLLKWTFQSIDASTGLPPDYPDAGFLPPDTDPPAGDGGVVFSVRPKAGTANGIQVANQAVVIFDQNSPINTPTWTNTIAAAIKTPLSVAPKALYFDSAIFFGDAAQTASRRLSGPRST
jgi:hypothetical protein